MTCERRVPAWLGGVINQMIKDVPYSKQRWQVKIVHSLRERWIGNWYRSHELKMLICLRRWRRLFRNMNPLDCGGYSHKRNVYSLNKWSNIRYKKEVNFEHSNASRQWNILTTKCWSRSSYTGSGWLTSRFVYIKNNVTLHVKSRA